MRSIVETRVCQVYYYYVFVDAQTLDATTRFTNIQFTADLHNTSSQAYKNLSDSFIAEVNVL